MPSSQSLRQPSHVRTNTACRLPLKPKLKLKPVTAALHQAMLCVAVGSGAVSFDAWAQAAAEQPSETVLPAVTVKAAANDATELPAAYAGGQTARGGRLGLLGNRGGMDTPFSTTSYTAQRIEDQQAVTLADVLNADPSIRFTGQTGGGGLTVVIFWFPPHDGQLAGGASAGDVRRSLCRARTAFRR